MRVGGIGMQKGQSISLWCAEDVERIRAMKNDGLGIAEIAKRIGRTTKAVREKFNRLASSSERRAQGSRQAWSPQEIERLLSLRNVEEKSWTEIARLLERPSGTVYSKYYHLTYLSNPIKTYVSAREIVPMERVNEWRHRQTLSPRDLTASLMGDPLPGFSALGRET